MTLDGCWIVIATVILVEMMWSGECLDCEYEPRAAQSGVCTGTVSSMFSLFYDATSAHGLGIRRHHEFIKLRSGVVFNFMLQLKNLKDFMHKFEICFVKNESVSSRMPEL